MRNATPHAGRRGFSGDCAVVTGAASGIGAATARRLAAEGAAVVLSDIRDAGAVVEQICSTGGRACFVEADAADESGWARVHGAARDHFGTVGVLVSNAFAVDVAAAHLLSPTSWSRQLDVNLTAAFLGVRALSDDLADTGGAVVVVSSVHALVGLPGHPAYAAAKGGLVALARQLAVEYGPSVRVNSVLPGPILTRVWDGVSQADRQVSVDQTVAGRFGTPDEVAAAITFLASDEASYITGASLVVDGGWTASKPYA